MDGHLLAAAHEHTTHLTSVTSVQTACTLTKQNQEKHTDKSHEQLPASEGSHLEGVEQPSPGRPKTSWALMAGNSGAAPPDFVAKHEVLMG